jgi:putative PIG3 family NAD(P)H quinone oxidoreductase
MRSAWISRFGGPEVLEIRDLDKPSPPPEHVLIRIHAAGLNRADLLQRQGKYPPPAGTPVEIPGIEFAGEVAELGHSARLWSPGQRVFGLAPGAAQAEYVVIHERLLCEIPPRLDWIQAAAVPEVFITAHDALWKQAALRPGESVLISAVGSGVGLAAVQLSRAIKAIPYGISRTPEKIAQARQYGIEDGLVVHGDFADLALSGDRWTRGRGFDVFLDLVGGPYPSAVQSTMASKGRMIFVGTMAGGKYELESRYVMNKRLELRGTVLRSRPLEEKIEVIRAFAKEVVPLLRDGDIRPVVDSVFNLEEIGKAHQRLESNQTVGKVVISIA